jgi:hypothetical protein
LILVLNVLGGVELWCTLTPATVILKRATDPISSALRIVVRPTLRCAEALPWAATCAARNSISPRLRRIRSSPVHPFALLDGLRGARLQRLGHRVERHRRQRRRLWCLKRADLRHEAGEALVVGNPLGVAPAD